ncbi:MAG TPA: lamin tail domain-containing protein [Chloroflexia bacterium]|nr:lamin tail domain-containing protein [Chloroflexia bacterium]
MKLPSRLFPIAALVLLSLTAATLLPPAAGTGATAQPQPQTDPRTFPETGFTVRGLFLKYWVEHGGLPQQGYPISSEFVEVSDLDGKAYRVQYFERAVFEYHPENPAPHNVLLSQLGTFRYKAKYGDAGAPGQQPNMQNGQLFPETGFYAGGVFLEYWKTHGGLPQQGYPISNEFTEVSDLDGKPYVVQYFERAVFEYHPEQQPPYNVLLSQLGTFRLREKYSQGPPPDTGDPPPPVDPVAPTKGPVPPQPTVGPERTPGTNCEPVDDSRKSTVGATGSVEIAGVQESGVERVTLRNNGQAPANIAAWTLRDKNDPSQNYTFPAGTEIAPGGTLDVYTEPGHPYTFNSRSSIWNNCGDALELLNSSGAVVATYAYGTHRK